MIEQTVDGESHYTVIWLKDKHESDDGKSVNGTWGHTSLSYNNKEIKFTGDNPQYLYWQWDGGPHGGDLSISSKMGRASHKAGEDEVITVYIKLSQVKRLANGRFEGEGSGKLTYRIGSDFKAGDIAWSVNRYDGDN
jgi:hypothetical protein